MTALLALATGLVSLAVGFHLGRLRGRVEGLQDGHASGYGCGIRDTLNNVQHLFGAEPQTPVVVFQKQSH